MKFHYVLKSAILIFFVLIILIGISLIIHKSFMEEKGPISEHNTLNLELSITDAPKKIVTFTEKAFTNVFCGTLKYFQVANVMYTVGEISMPFEKAICESKLTLFDIHYFAQKDAIAGRCTETCQSELGLTRFYYDYPSYKLIISNDLYETPDGKQHLIRSLTVTKPECNPVSLYSELDQEDWGIEFEVANVTSSSITLNYVQSGGQIIGQLRTGNFDVIKMGSIESLLPLDYTLPETFEIQHNTKGSIILCFEQRYGTLESGEYLLYLYLHDDYESEQVPPLTKNYHDMQCYDIAFSIP